MPISDKNRKILWGRSGNRCAMCRHPLVVDQTEVDSESVVGDECHIISGANRGPRYDPVFSASKVDDISNLMLLCRVHHKMIDDQTETYTAELLRSIKKNHEGWVEEKLKGQPQAAPVRIRRIKSEIPTQLPVVQSGKELLGFAAGCQGSYQDYSDDLNDEEADLVGGFLQVVSDWVDLVEGLEPIERIRAARALDEEIKRLNECGFMVFAAIENQRMEGGIGGPSTIRVMHISVNRSSDSGVVILDNESQ